MKRMTSFALFVLPMLLFGDTIEPVAGQDSLKKGFDFYKGKSDVEEDPIKKDYLKLIYEENEKQTKIQQDILDLLKKKLDPEPKMITKEDGTKCIANSSSDCFDYASLIENNPEVNKIPVLKEFLSDPYDLANAAKYLQWQQGGLFKHAFDVGNAIQMAQEQWGEKANPLMMNRSTYNTTSGISTAVLVPELKKKYLEELKDKTEYIIFLGYNKNLDILTASSIANIMMENPMLNFKIYYSSAESKALFEDVIERVYADNIIAFNNATKKIEPKIFETFGIYTTPSLVMSYKNEEKKKAQTIVTGRFNQQVFIERVFNFLEMNKLIDYTKFSDTQFWNTNGGEIEVKKYYKDTFGVEVLKDEK